MKLFGIIHTLDQYPPVVRHSMETRKSHIFILDGWKEVGEITFNFVVYGETACTEVQFPDMTSFIEEHADEGAREWAVWGSRIN